MSNQFNNPAPIAWTHNADYTNGAWVVRMEADFDTAGTPAVLEFEQNIPFSIKTLTIRNGSIRHEARKPEYSTFGSKTEWKSVAAIMVAIIGDPAMGDAGMGQGAYPFLNMLTETYDSVIQRIPGMTVQCNTDIPVSLDGSPYKIKFHIEITSEGGGWPQQLEISIAGKWTA